MVKLWEGDALVMPMYVHDRDNIRFYFELTWKRTGGSNRAPAEFKHTVDSTALDQYFLLTKDMQEMVIRDEGWPTRFDDCSPG